MNLLKNRSLAFKIILSVFAGNFVIFCVIFVINYRLSEQILEKNIVENAGLLTTGLAVKVEKTLTAVEKVTLNAANQIETEDINAKQLDDLIYNTVKNNSEIFGSTVSFEPYYFNKKEKYYAPYFYGNKEKPEKTMLGGEDYDYFTLDWYQIPKELEKPVWSEPYFDEGGGNILMSTYSVPLFKKINGEKIFIGIMTADVSLEWLQKLMDGVKVLESGYGILLSKTGTIVTHPNKELIINESVFSLAEELGSKDMREMGRKMIRGETGFADYKLKNLKTGKLSRTYYAPIKMNGWSIGVVYPEDELYSDIYYLNKVVFILGSTGLILLFAVIVFISNSITKPLKSLAVIARELAKGNFEVKPRKTRSKDEIGDLNNAFVKMQQALNTTIENLKSANKEIADSNKKLEEYNKNLELKVEERTKEISEKNAELESALVKLKETQAQLIQQEKMASLGGLTAGIAHEIKNPLNFVNNFSEITTELTKELSEEIGRQKEKIDADSIKYINEILADIELNAKKINEHGKRADSIVKGMLLHSRGKPGEKMLTDLNNLLNESVNLAYHGLRASDSSFNVKIVTDYDKTIGNINVVPQNMSRVFLNIINNACYAAYTNVKKAGLKFEPTISVVSKNLGDKIEVKIRDNGAGIPKENLDKIFNPFFTTKPAGKGTGLGLSMSYDIIVNEHKGEIKVDSVENNYTEFIIIIPVL